MTLIHESCAEGVSPQIGNPDLQHLPFEIGAPSLFPVLQANEPFCGIVAEMAGPEREILGNQGILSIFDRSGFCKSNVVGVYRVR